MAYAVKAAGPINLDDWEGEEKAHLAHHLTLAWLAGYKAALASVSSEVHDLRTAAAQAEANMTQ